MIPLGQAVGSEITRSKNVWIIVGISFLIGIIITVAEPDLQVLANQVPAIENNVIIWSVAVGVGVFLVIALLRILLGIQLRWLLIGSTYWCSDLPCSSHRISGRWLLTPAASLPAP